MLPVTLDTGCVRVSEWGIWEAFEKQCLIERYRIATLDKKVSHLQTFSLNAFVFVADAAKTKGMDFLVWLGGKRKIEDRYGNQWACRTQNSEVTSLLPLIDARISKNDTLVSLIFHVD
jgi:hypothetical protein